MQLNDRDIRRIALEKILTPVWHRRGEFAPGAGDSRLGLLPMPVPPIITELFRLDLECRREIIPGGGSDWRVDHQICGLLDRELGRIEIATTFPITAQRFTMLHELGHYLLHPGVTFHRDMPLLGHERVETRRRPRIELEADMFAAAVLMPERLTKDLFTFRYGGARSPDEMDQNFAYRLARGTRTEVTLNMLLFGTRRQRSLLFAIDQPNETELSFVELFQASKEAVAIRLEELNLVL